MSMEEKTQLSIGSNTGIGTIKQLIIVRKDLDVGLEKIIEASNAFLIEEIRSNGNDCLPPGISRHRSYLKFESEVDELYRRRDYHEWALDAAEKGEYFFYVASLGNYKFKRIKEPKYKRESRLYIDKETYDGWFGLDAEQPKDIRYVEDRRSLYDIIYRAEDEGLMRGRDYFLIVDADMNDIVCIGFRPLKAEIVDSI